MHRQKSALALAIILLSSLNYSAQIFRSMYHLPDTGETQSYTSTFGEDNDYFIFSPDYTLNSDGTLLDNITGLMWQQADGGEMTIENAVLYCANLTLGGYNDWRLPTAIESHSILDHQNANPAMNNAYFTTSAAEYWWTSEYQVNDANKVWVTNAGGGIGNHPKTETISAGGTKKFHVRAVRSVVPAQSFSTRFNSTSNESQIDNLTDLEWQQAWSLDTLTWEDALQVAENATLGGHDDWRLPNIKELQSIVDLGKYNPSFTDGIFLNATTEKYWASTTLPNQTTKAWYLDSHFGITTYDLKTKKHRVILVRSSTSTDLSEQVEKEVYFYPNPAYSEIHIKSTKATTYTVLNSVGEVLYSNISNNPLALDAGMYFIVIQNRVQRIVVE